MTVYTQKNKYIDEQIIALKAEIEVNNDNPQKIDELNERLRILNKEKVEVSANYPGNWTGLFQERLNSFIYFVRFKAVREEAMEDMPHGEPTIFDKPERFRGHYQSQIENYHQNIENVFSSTGYTFAERFNKKPTALGMQAETEGLCKFGVVFINAVKEDDSPLNSRQKKYYRSP